MSEPHVIPTALGMGHPSQPLSLNAGFTEPLFKNEPVPSPARELWHSFRQNRGALFGLGLISFFTLVALFAPWLAPQEPTQVFDDALRRAPAFTAEGDARFALGTDDIGRDVASRLVHGARVSLGIGFWVVCLSLTVGTILGLVAGYFGGAVTR